MSMAVLKGFLALAAASLLFLGAAVFYRRHRTLDSLSLLGGTACFIVVALTHVFEAFEILQAARWGQPGSIGHYIDLGAAVLGLTLVCSGLVLRYVHPSSTRNETPE